MISRKCPHKFYECIECGDVSMTKTRTEEHLILAALRYIVASSGFTDDGWEILERAAFAVSRERGKAKP
jgi:hypothetical protein